MSIVDKVAAFQKSKVEKRAVGGAAWQPWTDPFFRFDAGGPVHPSRQVLGAHKALALPALFGGTKLLADSLASLPLKLYTLDRNGGKVPYGGPSIFDQPDLSGTLYTWLFSAVCALILHGNAWGLITGRDGFGFPTGIQWVPNERVIVEQDNDDLLITHAKVFVNGRQVQWFGPDAEVFHIAAYPLPGRLEGLSIIRACASTILHGQQQTEFSNGYFAAGGQPNGVFRNGEREVDPTQAEMVRKQLVQVQRTHQPLVIGMDWEYTPFTVSPSDAQLVEAMQLTATQVAAMLNLPAGRLGGTEPDQKYSSETQEELAILAAVRPYRCMLEAAFNAILPQKRTCEFDTRALLDVDPLTEVQIDAQLRTSGIETADEIRARRNLPALANGIGKENLPAEVLVSMARGAGVIPKSWSGAVESVAQPTPDEPNEASGQADTNNPPATSAPDHNPTQGHKPVTSDDAAARALFEFMRDNRKAA